MKKIVLKMTATNGKTLEFEFENKEKYKNTKASFIYEEGKITKELLSYCAYELIGDNKENKVSQIKFCDGVEILDKECLSGELFKYAEILEFPKTLKTIVDDKFNRDKSILNPFYSVNYIVSNGNPIVKKYFRNMYHNMKITNVINEFNKLNNRQSTQELFLEMTDIKGKKYKFPFAFEREIYPYTLTHEVFEKIFEANKNIKPDEITSITVPEGVRRILVNDTTFSKNLTKISLPHSLEYLYWRGLFNKNKFPNLSFEVDDLKAFYDDKSMIMYFYDDQEKSLIKDSIDYDLVNNILSNPKLAEICVEKAFSANSNNKEIICAIRPESLFDENHPLSKLPDNVKMQILKLWAIDKFIFGQNIDQQRKEFDKIIYLLPEKFRAEFDLYITELLIKRLVDRRDAKAEDVKSYMLKKGIEYCKGQLEQSGLSQEKRAIFHKYIANYSEGLDPKYRRDKNDFNNLLNLIKTANSLEKWLSDSHYEISAFEGILDADFKYKSIVPKDEDDKCFLGDWCKKFDKYSVLPAVEKINFDGVFNGQDAKQKLKESYLHEGYFGVIPPELILVIISNMKTKLIRDIYTWNNFINSIDPARRSDEMDIAFFKSLPSRAFDINILDILDGICGKKINIVLPVVSEDDIKIELPVKQEERISLLMWFLNLFSKIRNFLRNLFVGEKKIEQLPSGKDKTRGKKIGKSYQKKICPVEVIKTPVQIKSGNKISLPKMENMKGDEKTIGG